MKIISLFVYVYIFFSSYDHPHILAGQGTMGLEVIEQVPDVDAILIPVGGGGLIAGTALAMKTLKPDVKVYVSKQDGVTIKLCLQDFIDILKRM